MIADLRPYPAMKDSGVEWLGKVPEHWEVRQLGRMGQFLKGNGGTKADEVTDGVSCVRYGDLYTQHKFFIRASRSYITPERAADYTPIQHGDVLFAGSGETIEEIGKSAVNLIESEACCGGDVILFRPSIEVEPRFMGYATDCPQAVYQKARMGRGITVMHIYGDQLKYMWIALPSLPEQAAIVRYLDHVDRLVRRYVRAKQKLIGLLEEQKQAITHRAVTRGLDPDIPLKPSGNQWFPETPVHWDVLPMRRVIRRSIDGPHYSPEYLDQGVPFLSARNIKTDRWSLDDAKFISESDYHVFCRRVTPELGDVLYTKGGTTGVARAVDLNFRFQVWVHVAVLMLNKKKILPEFLAAALNTPRCFEQSQLLTRGATNQDLGLGRMKDIVLPVPPLSEQGSIMVFLEAATVHLARAITSARREIELLGEYRTRLIADVVTGKLDVREAAANLPNEPDELEPLDEADDLMDEDDATVDHALPEEVEA